MKSEMVASRKPVSLCLFWGFVLPQVILLLLNLRSWSLIRGEANERELSIAILFLCFEIAIIFAISFTYWAYNQRKIEIDWKIALCALTGHVLYMWLFIINVERIIPDTIQPWILSEENVGRWNVTLFMPGVFLSLYALSRNFFSRFSASRGALITVIAIVGMPVTWYLLVSLMQPAWQGQYVIIASIIVATLVVIVFLGAVIRLFDNIIHKPSFVNLAERHYIIAIVLGLAAPLGGLALNHKIPFPVDFQSTGVYALTMVNGLVLLIKPGGERFMPVKLFLRCATFPFIFYFFLVFLPFLPLSLIAIFAIGTGFLMLTPLALGLFQARITFSEFSQAENKLGKTKAIVLSVAGLMILPLYFLIQAVLDKNALDSSLNYFYSHDTSSPALTESQINRSANTLVQLRDRKSDIQLPYISGFYNTVVFGNLVLSDRKITRLYKLLTNSGLPDKHVPIVGSARRSRPAFGGGRLLAPDMDTAISHIDHSTTTSGEAKVRLTIQNASSSTHSLYAGKIYLPEGVFVTGLRLKIEGEWVSGKVFDRKTALWVFQKITEVRRDPALLYYQSPTIAELRVYPFPSEGIREVEIDFSFHTGMDAKIVINKHAIDLNPAHDANAIVAQNDLVLVNDAMAKFAFRRTPYIHFILDYAKHSKLGTAEYIKNIVRASKELGISKLHISAANIGVSKGVSNGYLDANDAKNIASFIDDIQLEEAGGFWIEQAIAKEMLRVSDSIDDQTFRHVPIFVVISGAQRINTEDISLETWSRLIPDSEDWYSYTDNRLQRHGIGAKQAESKDQNIPQTPVIALKQGANISLLAATRSSVFQSKSEEDIHVFEPSSGRFIPLPTQSESVLHNNRWSDYAGAWLTWRDNSLNPSDIESERASMLKRSKELGLLLPTSSYIVVESASQWEILKRKEKQSLSNHSGLDFEDEQQTSEPPWWLLLAGLLMYLYYRQQRQNLDLAFEYNK